MSASLKQMSVAEFLAWEERQDLRYEFDGIRTVAMTGGTTAHAAIQSRLLYVLWRHLDGKPCRPYGSELRVQMEHSVRYPDAFVTCIPGAPSATVATDPVVVFEILSKSTGSDDLGAKKAEYQATASVQRYVVLHQTHRIAEVFYRGEEGWEFETLSGSDVMNMPEIGISVSLAEIYKGITLVSDLPL